ncbi:hotdog fold thioesterase [Salicibibacter halophilus]|uniref:Hotdog fold thioesterase n=1 Tax=Salicibibacter halophilus TaxID=2502791 RepID=A0A514LKP0_9BACI|nr:hotdog fold thioesterase [Salicibibacter halophilus]QDI92363.1 hotdog fold thioesterase [Salicibibacter halophilus]
MEQHTRNVEEQLQAFSEGSLIALLDITFVEATQDRLVLQMPVQPKTHQPAGILHGGASVVLAETAASLGTALNIDQETKIPVGLEINANHVRSKQDGVVTATATPLHKGKTTMIWEIKIVDEDDKLVCVSRCTMAVLDKK